MLLAQTVRVNGGGLLQIFSGGRDITVGDDAISDIVAESEFTCSRRVRKRRHPKCIDSSWQGGSSEALITWPKRDGSDRKFPPQWFSLPVRLGNRQRASRRLVAYKWECFATFSKPSPIARPKQKMCASRIPECPN